MWILHANVRVFSSRSLETDKQTKQSNTKHAVYSFIEGCTLLQRLCKWHLEKIKVYLTKYLFNKCFAINTLITVVFQSDQLIDSKWGPERKFTLVCIEKLLTDHSGLDRKKQICNFCADSQSLHRVFENSAAQGAAIQNRPLLHLIHSAVVDWMYLGPSYRPTMWMAPYYLEISGSYGIRSLESGDPEELHSPNMCFSS